MVGKSKKPKTGLISEEYVDSLLTKYSATTLLTLMQEIAQNPGVKFDWNELVKKTATGITNAREYQMLWRHLAYQHPLDDKFKTCAEPLDDDSDLEYEIEAFPPASSEAQAEAAACVKVMIASGALSSDANANNGSTVEAPLTILIPNGSSDFGGSVTVPVTVQKCESFASITSLEKLDNNNNNNGTASANNSQARRKRKVWNNAEDEQLIAAVGRLGEGNWASIVKTEFAGERTASQLSQRWAIIRKKQGPAVVNVGSGSGNGSQLSEAQLAARRAMSLALNMPMGGDNLRSVPSATGTTGNNIQSRAGETPLSVAARASTSGAAGQRPSAARPLTGGGGASSSRSRAAAVTKKPPITTKGAAAGAATPLSPESMLKAAAVAAGARIATPSDAATLLKAAQSKNAVHIMPSGSGNTTQLPSNVHFIKTGLASAKPILPNYTTAPASRFAKTPVQPQLKPVPTPMEQDAATRARKDNSGAETSSVMDKAALSGPVLKKNVMEGPVASPALPVSGENAPTNDKSEPMVVDQAVNGGVQDMDVDVSKLGGEKENGGK